MVVRVVRAYVRGLAAVDLPAVAVQAVRAAGGVQRGVRVLALGDLDHLPAEAASDQHSFSVVRDDGRVDDLTAFVTARLDEDEEWAHAARSGYVLRWLAAGRAIIEL